MNRIDSLILRRKEFAGPVLVLAAMVGPIIWCVEAGDAATLTVTAQHGSVIGTPHKAHYELYQDRYGIDIFVDRQDLTLPQGRGWDIGALGPARNNLDF